ncbi:MAG: heavy-metal-associated domain-containing protein [Synechococcales cyanobacterium C42_A2020_086]|jgi:copper chaperone|nr:heavy-metal-associated domain-containing protein [Synechococcales cyanobacterium C42_A2020_086]
MMQIKVPSIVCEGCIETLTKAVTKLDPNAKVTGDLANKTLTIDTTADVAAVKAAMVEVGHSPE